MVVPGSNKEGQQDERSHASERAGDMLNVRGGGTSPLDGMKEAADAASKTVVAAALAGAVATGAAAVTPDQIHLPEPTPIVQTVDQPVEEPDQTVDDQAEKKAAARKNLLKILKYALLALFFAAAFLFGILKGCAACSGSIAAPLLQDSSSSSQAAEVASTMADSSAAAEASASQEASTSAA